MNRNNQRLVSVFHSNNLALFESAKLTLGNNAIEYFPTGEFIASAMYGLNALEIKVFDKDEDNARKALSELVEDTYNMNDKFDGKAKPYIGYILFAGIILFVAALFGVYVLTR